LRKEIRAIEMDLRRLKDEESQLATLAGHGRGAQVAANGAIRSSVGRVNWGMVLEQMPKPLVASTR
jgi:hypothetical protein